MIKKHIAIAVAVLTVLSSSAFICTAAEDNNEPDLPETLKSGDYEYTVYNDTAAITRYTGDKKDVTIPSELQGKKIVNIGPYSFANNKNITSVTIPESVLYLGIGAFSDCTNLSWIDLPETPVHISGSAFINTAYYNNSINWTDGAFYIDKNLIFADETATGDFVVRKGTRNICYSAFDSNESITSVFIPSSVKTIGIDAFSCCTNLKKVTMEEGVEEIGNWAFYGCERLTDINIPDSVTTINKDAFNYTPLIKDKNWSDGALYIGNHLIMTKKSLEGEFKLREGTVSIAEEAFAECAGLSGIKLNDGLKTIGRCAFTKCEKLKTVTIPETVTSIGEYALGYSYSFDYDDYGYPVEEKDKTENFMIKGKKGTAAEKYAADNGFTFIDHDEIQKPTGFKLKEALYAHAVSDSMDGEAWQAWQNFDNIYYFFLPSSTEENKADIYNAYSDDITVNGVKIAAGKSAEVSFEAGKQYEVTVSNTKRAICFMRSNAEAAIYVNNSDADGKGSELLEYLNADKSRSAKATGAIVTPDGKIDNTSVKKIKGRGNTTWRLPKKAYNITYGDKVSIAGMKSSKKYSLLANCQDDSLARNRFLYDLSDAVGMPYASDSRFVDFYSNGKYIGSYQLCEKIEVGKNSLISDFSETDYLDSDGNVKEDFPFLCEVDFAAKDGEDYYTTLNNYMNITIKSPELEEGDKGYNEVKEYVRKKFYDMYISASNSSSDLSKYADIDSMTKMYLINELGKNWDAGVSSLFFTYKKDDSGQYKFFASPVWDYDNSLGNAVGVKGELEAIGVDDYTDYTGWWCRYKGTQYTYGADSILAKLAVNKTIVENSKKIWKEYFIPAIDHFRGAVVSRELKNTFYTRNKYFNLLKDSAEMNYACGWRLRTSEWIADHTRLKTSVYDEDANTYYVNKAETTYSNDFKGVYDFCADWMISRAAWLTKELGDNVKTAEIDNTPAKTETPQEASEKPEKEAEITIQKDVNSSVKLKAGEKLKLLTAGGEATDWKSSNAKVVTVKNGTLTGLKKGSANITASLKNGGKLKVSVTVTTSPKLSKKSVTVKKGNTVKVKITGKASTVKNTYKNTKTAKITSKISATTLTIKGLKRGKTTLIITVNGIKLRLKVKVK